MRINEGNELVHMQSSRPGEMSVLNTEKPDRDAVFGELNGEGPNYRDVGWIGTVALMMKTQIGLGVLAIPTVFDTLGIVPGVFCLIAVAIITTWSDYIIGVFKLRHPEVYAIDDAGALMFGRAGREFFGVVFCLYWIFVGGSGMLGLSIGLNAVSLHATCTSTFVAVAAVVGFGIASIRTLGKITWLAWIGLACILTAIFTVTVAVGLQDRPAAATSIPGPFKSDFKLVNNPSFLEAAAAVSSLVFAFAGTPAFFNIVSEMRSPAQYTRSLLICQSGVTLTYTIIGCVVYYFCGSFVASPALGSAGPLVKRVAYGFAIPGLIVTTCITIHLPAKFLWLRCLRGTRHITEPTIIHWASWIACTFGTTIIAYVIASSVPVFDSLVSLVGALLGTLMCFQPMGCMWLYDNWTEGKKTMTKKWKLMVSWSVFVIAIGTFIMFVGTWGAVIGIMKSYKSEGGAKPWMCEDNSNSVGFVNSTTSSDATSVTSAKLVF